MKWILAAVAVLMLTACGSNFEWFPETSTITSFSPTTGPSGTVVTINGTNFSKTPADNIVKFNGTEAVVTSSTSSQIVTTVPNGATTGPITVMVDSKIATSATNFTVSSATDPVITSFSPTQGLAGTVVTISGTNFSTTSASNTVKFNGTTAVVTNSTASQIVTSVPTGATTGPITVTVDSKTTTSATNFTVNIVTTLAGTNGVSGSADGLGVAAKFNVPSGITSDGTNLYLADQGNHKIRKIVIATGAVTTMAGTGVDGSTDGPGAAASFSFPSGITSDGTNLYVADSGNNTIRKIVIASGNVSTLAGSAGVFGSNDGTGAAAEFAAPRGITTDGTNLYVADSGNNTIRKIVITSGAVSTLAGTAGNTGSDDGTGAAASFDFPVGIIRDGSNLYVADASNSTIRKIVIATGVVTTIAGTGVSGSTDGNGTSASFNFPDANGITTDGTNLYVADSGNNSIRKIVIASADVTTIATNITGLFNNPTGITTVGSNLFISDTGNNTIRKIE